jgi:glycine betaine/proline transport system substrate-binding protein
LVVIGEAFSDATTGLVVPTYVTINSIEELNANKDKFKGENWWWWRWSSSQHD